MIQTFIHRAAWLLPLTVVAAAVAAATLLILASRGVAPFVYTIF